MRVAKIRVITSVEGVVADTLSVGVPGNINSARISIIARDGADGYTASVNSTREGVTEVGGVANDFNEGAISIAV